MRNAYLMGAALVALLPIAAQAQPKTVSKQVYQLHQKLIEWLRNAFDPVRQVRPRETYDPDFPDFL